MRSFAATGSGKGPGLIPLETGCGKAAGRSCPSFCNPVYRRDSGPDRLRCRPGPRRACRYRFSGRSNFLDEAKALAFCCHAAFFAHFREFKANEFYHNQEGKCGQPAYSQLSQECRVRI